LQNITKAEGFFPKRKQAALSDGIAGKLAGRAVDVLKNAEKIRRVLVPPRLILSKWAMSKNVFDMALARERVK